MRRKGVVSGIEPVRDVVGGDPSREEYGAGEEEGLGDGRVWSERRRAS